MRCSKARKLISAQLDGEVRPDIVAKLEEHQTACGGCRRYAAELAAFDADLEMLASMEPQADFVARTMERIGEGSAQRRMVLSRPELFRPLAAGLGLAACVVGFAVGSWMDVFAAPDSTTTDVWASDAIDPTSDGAVEVVLLAMVSGDQE